jgi:xanthine dehydrogenase molybdenum-binding subunit
MEVVDWHARRAQTPPSRPIRRGWGIGCEMHGSSAYPASRSRATPSSR